MLRILAVLIGLLAVGIWLLPLRFVTNMANLEAAGISASAVNGSVWNGELEGLTIRGAALGDVNVATDPISMITGAPKLSFRSSGPISQGAVTVRSNGPRFSNLRGQIALTQLDPQAPSGAVATFIDASLDLSANACTEASGQARIVGMAAAGMPDMSGPISCEEGRVRLSLTPDGDRPGPEVDLFVDLTSPGQPQLFARTSDPNVQMALPAYGIEVIAP